MYEPLQPVLRSAGPCAREPRAGLGAGHGRSGLGKLGPIDAWRARSRTQWGVLAVGEGQRARDLLTMQFAKGMSVHVRSASVEAKSRCEGNRPRLRVAAEVSLIGHESALGPMPDLHPDGTLRVQRPQRREHPGLGLA
jgi:hypothetical protein